MIRSLLFILFCLLTFSAKAQLDTEHWLAPMFYRLPSEQVEVYVTLSTNETSPFVVRMYNDNKLYKTATISKGNAQTVTIDADVMFTSNSAEALKVLSKGLFLSGDKKYYAVVKFKISDSDLLKNSSEIYTSKGSAGLGTLFYAMPVSIYTRSQKFDFQTSVIATQDNTDITVSGYNKDVVFADGSKKPSNISIHLDKGQSYIIEGGLTDMQPDANKQGFIAAKIQSTKPISVTSGNFLSMLNSAALPNGAVPSGDIFMDQVVPVNKLGKEFVLFKGAGSMAAEGAYVVATEDNTKVTAYGPSGPQSLVLAKAGNIWPLDAYYYNSQSNGFSNFAIVADKKVYVNQVLTGTSSYTSGASTLVPALDCFIPSRIDEVASVDMIGPITFGAPRINITAKKGAKVYVNGSLLGGTSGPFPVAGITDWEVYNIRSFRGTLEVKADKSVLASVIGYDEGTGYSTYFSGFDIDPQIQQTGDCFTRVRLEVNGEFESYQWYFNGTKLPGETSSILYPDRYGVGNYYCVITNGTCEPKTTPVFFYNLVCPDKSDVTIDMGICQTRTLTPVFAHSTLPIDISKTVIIGQPSFGTAVVQSDGTILYTPNVGNVGTYQDFFVVQIEGGGHKENINYFVNIHKVIIKTISPRIFKCRDAANNVEFDLTSVRVSDDTTDVYEYYESLADAKNQTNKIIDPQHYTMVQDIWVRVTNVFGCVDYGKIELATSVLLDVVKTDFTDYCIDLSNPTKHINLAALVFDIASNAGSFSFNFYRTLAEAQSGTSNGLPYDFSFNGPVSLYLRIWFPNCNAQILEIKFGFANQTIVNSIPDIDVCKSSFSQNGGYPIDLSIYKTAITSDSSAQFGYYATFTDAINGTNPINPLQSISNPSDFFVSVKSNGLCANVVRISFIEKPTKTSDSLKDIKVCSTGTGVLDAGPGFDSYKWSTGETTQSINAGIGNYWVELTIDGCTTRQNVNVTAYDNPVISKIDIKGNVVTITASGGKAPYRFAVDDGDFSDNNVFSGLSNGLHTVKLRDANNCTVIEMPFSIFTIVNAFSPNGDGVNDILDFSELKLKQNPKMTIFDRQGTKVFEGSSTNNFIWTGKDAGRPFPTGTYWYVLEWTEVGTSTFVQRNGWVLLKNR